MAELHQALAALEGQLGNGGVVVRVFVVEFLIGVGQARVRRGSGASDAPQVTVGDGATGVGQQGALVDEPVYWMPFAGRHQSGYNVGGIPYTMHDMTQEKMIVFRYS